MDCSPPVPLSTVVNSRSTARVIVEIDLSNVMHLPSVDKCSMRLEIHAEYVAEQWKKYDLSQSISRNVSNVELHIDNPSLLPGQKISHPKSTRCSEVFHSCAFRLLFAETSVGQNSNANQKILRLNEKVPDSWTQNVFSNRRFKSKWGSAAMAFPH